MDVKTRHLAELSPSYSHSTYVSTKTRRGNGGFLYDDYAREIPVAPLPPPARNWQAARPRTTVVVTFKSPLRILVCLALVAFVVQLGASLPDVPSTQLLQNILCQRALEAPGPTTTESTAVTSGDNRCRGMDVQTELNVLSMGALVLGYLPGLLVAIPYAMLSDRCGRKAVLGLSVFGVVVSQLLWAVTAWNWRRWDLRYTWASLAALLVGGGESVAQAMIFAMIADIAPEGTYFNLTMGAIMLGEAAAPFVAAGMMTYSLWLPLLAAPAVVTLGGLLVPIIPDTLATKRYHETHDDNNKERSPSPEPVLFGSCCSSRRRRPPNFDPSATPWSRARDAARATLRLLGDGDVRLLLPCASLAVPVVTAATSIALRYVPARFGRTLAEAGMILGACTGLNMLVLVVLLPRLGGSLSASSSSSSPSSTTTTTTATTASTTSASRGEKKRHLLTMARISTALLVVGQATLAAAPDVAVAAAGLAVTTLGSGAPSLCRRAFLLAGRATAAGGSGKYPVGRVLGVLVFCEALAHVVCGVGFGALYQVCIRLAGPGPVGGGGNDENHYHEEDNSGGHGGGWILALVFYVAASILFGCGGVLAVVDAEDSHGLPLHQSQGAEEASSSSSGGADPARDDGTRRATRSESDEETLHEVRIFWADGRIVRKGPLLPA